MVRGYKTFKEFQESGEGIATNILANRLQKLVANEIITAESEETDGRKINYRLTPKGIDLAPVLLELLLWSSKHEQTGAPCELLGQMGKNREAVLAETIAAGSSATTPPCCPDSKVTPQHNWPLQKGASHEPSTSPRRHTQRRIRPHLRRQARRNGKSAAPTSPAGKSTTSKARPPTPTASTPPNPAAGSARSSSAPTTAAKHGSLAATSSSTTASPAPTSGTTAPPPLGIQARLASRALAHRSRHRLRRRRRRRPLPLHRRRHKTGTNSPACAATAPAPAGSPEPAACASTPSFSTPPTPTASSSPSPPPAPSAPTMAAKPGSPSTRASAPNTSPTPPPKSATASTASPCTPSRPDVLFMQKHWDVMRTDNAGDSWHEVSGNLPTDFGFVIDVHAHEPETIYVVPIKSDSEHFPPEGKLRVYRSRTGGNEWEPLTNGLPQQRLLRQRPPRRHGRRLPRLLRHLLRHHRRPGLRLPRRRRHTGPPSSAIFPPSSPSRSKPCHNYVVLSNT